MKQYDQLAVIMLTWTRLLALRSKGQISDQEVIAKFSMPMTVVALMLKDAEEKGLLNIEKVANDIGITLEDL